MSNDYVKMESKQCPVCMEVHEHDTGILLNKRLKDIKPNYKDKVVTGMGLCKVHDDLHKQGYIALIECVNSDERKRIQIADIERTGRVLHIRTEAFNNIVGEQREDGTNEMICVDEEFFNQIEALIPVH